MARKAGTAPAQVAAPQIPLHVETASAAGEAMKRGPPVATALREPVARVGSGAGRRALRVDKTGEEGDTRGGPTGDGGRCRPTTSSVTASARTRTAAPVAKPPSKEGARPRFAEGGARVVGPASVDGGPNGALRRL